MESGDSLVDSLNVCNVDTGAYGGHRVNEHLLVHALLNSFMGRILTILSLHKIQIIMH